MSMFRWTAPLLKLASKRRSAGDFARVAASLHAFVPSGGHLLDLGGGTGELGAGVAAQLGAHVIVADATEQVLSRVTAGPRVSVRRASAERLPFPDAYFDAVLCSDAFHHFTDQGAAAHEMARVVREGGAVLLFEYEPNGFFRAVALVERLLGEPAAFLWPQQLQTMMGSYGIVGTITRGRGAAYSFLGERKAQRPDASATAYAPPVA